VYLEVTEKALTDVSLLHKHMARLQEEGVSFVLDDFGSFSSNLDRLKENPFMSIKLDRKMVWNYFKSPDSILPHIIAACHEMNLTVVAEGVEDSYMAETLRMLGCDYFQGYYYSRPIPAAEFLENYC
jgi:EAL domain-containing protein (putative c-di-GMP-specific phosphodiesterase class I)